MKDRIKRVLVWIPVVIMFFIITGFSGQKGNESSDLSYKTSRVIINVANTLHIIDVNDDNIDQYIEKIEYPVRKIAHFSEYALLCILVYFALFVNGLRGRAIFICSVIISAAFAGTDEIHQLFVPGRSGRITDVLIDTLGAFAGACLCVIVYKIKICCKNRKRII